MFLCARNIEFHFLFASWTPCATRAQICRRSEEEFCSKFTQQKHWQGMFWVIYRKYFEDSEVRVYALVNKNKAHCSFVCHCQFRDWPNCSCCSSNREIHSYIRVRNLHNDAHKALLLEDEHARGVIWPCASSKTLRYSSVNARWPKACHGWYLSAGT